MNLFERHPWIAIVLVLLAYAIVSTMDYEEAREAVAEGQDPEEVCCEYFGLEPDYIWELL